MASMAESQPSTPSRPSIVVLDGVRAIACLLVIIYHVNYHTFKAHIWHGNTIGSIGTALALSGWSGVTLFFVLSGFLLFLPYAQALLFDKKWPEPGKFYLKRMCRILPGYYASLILLIVLAYPEYLRPERWRDTGLFLSFLMDMSPQTYQHINGPYWTLAVEWQFYMCLPLLAFGLYWLCKRFQTQWRCWIVLGGLAVLIGWGLFTRYCGAYFSTHTQESVLVPRQFLNVLLAIFYGQSGKYLEDFAVGMFLCLIYAYTSQADASRRLSQWLQRLTPMLFLLGLGWLFGMATITTEIPLLRPWLGAGGWLTELGYALGFGFCLLALLFGSFGVKSFLEQRYLCKLGQVSYSLYIWHNPILQLLVPLILPLSALLNNILVYVVFWICAALLVFPCAYLFYRLIEVPGIRLGSRWRQGNALR
ncbi:acyltransferase family protein [Ktedonospora formicarum]|uniref:Acyltransferase 3 domain-containing protein n=1 Tax=Ktedonospora formicarum TaxID=2778364 RepID=A0A8J3MR24_9CHLR|nr:acyltransferase [Ktedonospora formicarum]GHO43361.1 hypothetical protein KSX_15240 [Ktedonospora formicarum]